MQIITLTTDFGLRDPAGARLKGMIFNELSEVNVVDISHNVTPFNIIEGSYIIKNAYKSFPKGTIHIIDIDSEWNDNNIHIAALMDDHYFVCTNNGILSLIGTTIKPTKMVEINIHKKMDIESEYQIFPKVACHIARGGALDVVGKNIDQLKQTTNIEPYINDNKDQIVGKVIFIDNYGNVVTNINKKLIDEVGKGRKFEILVRHLKFNHLYKRYNEAENLTTSNNIRQSLGKSMVLINSQGFLEVAIYRSNPKTSGGASTLLGLDVLDSITVNFLKPKKRTNTLT